MRQTAAAARRRAGGSSLLEIAVVAIVVAVLAGTLLQRLNAYRSQAELADVQRTVGVMRAALLLRQSQLQVRGREDAVAALADANPMDWLAQKPSTYAGEYFAPGPELVGPGHWYFDRKIKVLVYLLNYGKSFPPGMSKSLKYKVKLLGLPQHFAKPTSAPGLSGIALIQVDG